MAKKKVNLGGQSFKKVKSLTYQHDIVANIPYQLKVQQGKVRSSSCSYVDDFENQKQLDERFSEKQDNLKEFCDLPQDVRSDITTPGKYTDIKNQFQQQQIQKQYERQLREQIQQEYSQKDTISGQNSVKEQ